MDPRTENEIRRAQYMHDFISEKLAGKYPSNDSASIFARYLSLAQSHHEAIIVLCHYERLIGSAYALLRPLVEAVNRGLFTAFLATPEQIETIKTGGSPYGGFEQLANELEGLFNAGGVFAGRTGEAWKTLCGLTHGGLEQLNWRVGDDGEIGCHFQEEDVRQLLASSTVELFKIAVCFLGKMDRHDASQAVNAQYIALYSDPTHL